MRADMPDQLLEDHHARAVANDVRMHRELVESALGIGHVELAPEDLQHTRRRRVGAQRREAIHVEVDRVVADPLDRQLDDAGRLAVEQQLVAVVVGHQRGVVEQAHVARDGQRVRREIPRRRADADRALARDSLQHVGRAHLQVALRSLGQDRVALVDPAVDADLVALGDHAALLVGMEHGRDGRHIEGRRDRVFLQQRQDARDAGAVAVLALRQATDRLAAFAQLAGLVVGVERDRHGAARAVRPNVGPQRRAGAHALDNAAPALLGPLPGLLLLLRLGNDGRACSRHGLLLLRLS